MPTSELPSNRFGTESDLQRRGGSANSISGPAVEVQSVGIGQNRPFVPGSLYNALEMLPVGKYIGKMISYIRPIAAARLVAAGLIYLSLVVPGRLIAVCSNLGTAIYCPVLGYGFPLPFIAVSQGMSQVGSAARDPLSILSGEDEVLWPRLGLSTLFWMVIVVNSRVTWPIHPS